MIKENYKYGLFKWSDADAALCPAEINILLSYLDKIRVYRYETGRVPNPQFVCIKETWPEYETVWNLLEKRVDNESAIYSRYTP